MAKKLLLIFNPQSGKAKIKGKLFDIVNIFAKEGWEIQTYPTQKEKDAFEFIKERGAEFDRIVASGGDGTLNEAVHGLMCIPKDARPELGYIPAGTVNDFASNLKIPKNMTAAAQKIVDGSPFKCDIGKFNDRHFVYVAAFGAFTNVSYETPQQTKNTLGQMAYFLEGIKQLHMLPSYKLKIICDEEEIVGEFALGMVSNSNHIAGFKTVTSLKADLNDGLFEVILIKKPKSLFELSDMASRLMSRDFNTDKIRVFRTKKIEFECEESVSWTLDGEYGGAVKNAVISAKKEAVSLVV